jgi:hypothetical protein
MVAVGATNGQDWGVLKAGTWMMTLGFFVSLYSFVNESWA